MGQNTLERVAQDTLLGIGETLCNAVTAPKTIVEGVVDGDLGQVAGGVLDIVDGATIVGAPAAGLARSAGGQVPDALVGDHVYLPQLDGGHPCLASAFNSRAPLTAMGWPIPSPTPAGTVIEPVVVDCKIGTSMQQPRPSMCSMAAGGLY